VVQPWGLTLDGVSCVYTQFIAIDDDDDNYSKLGVRNYVMYVGYSRFIEGMG
jgi:hypothetical protein